MLWPRYRFCHSHHVGSNSRTTDFDLGELHELAHSIQRLACAEVLLNNLTRTDFAQRFEARGTWMMKTLSNDEARHLFQITRVARLGCIVNDEPYVVPVNCYLEGDYLYSHSLPGLKISALRENPHVCVQVDQIETELCWRSALVFGKYEEITTANERADILSKLLRLFPMLTPVESAIAIDGSAPKVIIFRIKIERVTGVSEG